MKKDETENIKWTILRKDLSDGKQIYLKNPSKEDQNQEMKRNTMNPKTNEDLNNEFCCECGVSFQKVQKCGPIIKAAFEDFPPMACAVCFTINKIEMDLQILKLFVKNQQRNVENDE